MKKLVTLLALPFVLWSCNKTGTKALEQGNYYQAVLQSVEKLKKDSRNEKAASVLPDAYKMASNDFLSDIERTEKSNFPFRWEKILDNYTKLNQMQEMIERCTACRRLVSPQSYYKEAEESRDKAADERYALATSLLKRNTKEAGRDAYNHFEKIYSFAPNYRDVRDRMEDALNMGSYHVVVEQPRLNSRMYQYSNDYFQGKIDEFLRTNRRMNKFIRFYTPAEAKSTKLSPDHVVHLEIMDFVVGETNMNTDRSTVYSKDSVKTGEATINGMKVPVYGKVKAELTKYHKAVRSRGILLVEIVDFRSNKTLLHEEVPGEYNWFADWARYNGDDRALTEQEKQLCRNGEQMPPAPQQLFIEFTKPIYDQVTSRIKRFYDKY